MANVIFLGTSRGVAPRTVCDRKLDGSGEGCLPGEFVTFSHFPWLKRDSLSRGPLVLLADQGQFGLMRPHVGGVSIGPEPLDVPYRGGDTAFGYLPAPGEVYQVRLEAGTYAPGQELTIGGWGRLKKAGTGSARVIAVFAQPTITLDSGNLARVVIQG